MGIYLQVHPRRAQLSDIDALVQLERHFPSDRLSCASFRGLLQRGRAQLWVQEKQGSIVASAVVLYRRGAKVARVYSLVVHPRHQRQGIGRALMLWAEKSAYRRGCREMRLEVRRQDMTSIALYQKIGYEVIDKIEKYYQDGADALKMKKRLKPAAETKPRAAARSRAGGAAYPTA